MENSFWVDKEAYIYYKDSKLKDYDIILENTIKDGYKFILNGQNEPFNSLFSYFVSTLNYQNIRYNYYKKSYNASGNKKAREMIADE